MQSYLASMTFADDCLGKVLHALEETGKINDMIIIVWSDHGWHLGEKGHWRKNNTMARGYKKPSFYLCS